MLRCMQTGILSLRYLDTFCCLFNSFARLFFLCVVLFIFSVILLLLLFSFHKTLHFSALLFLVSNKNERIVFLPSNWNCTREFMKRIFILPAQIKVAVIFIFFGSLSLPLFAFHRAVLLTNVNGPTFRSSFISYFINYNCSTIFWIFISINAVFMRY